MLLCCTFLLGEDLDWTTNQVEGRSDQFLAFGLSLSLVQARGGRSDMARLAR